MREARDELALYHRPTKENIILDASRGLLPITFSRRVPGRRKAWEIDVSYSDYEGFGWVPSEWNAAIDNGQVIKHVKCRVTDVSINHEVPKESFVIHFPSGTRVIDRRANSRRELISDNGTLVAIGENSDLGGLRLISYMVAVLLVFIVVVSWLRKYRSV
jgi:hypothetical protein